MIPLRLHLRNFLSYGETCDPIDLDGVHVACLCGPNGHGKSALLDAITWCLWGQARSNSADDLVRLGQAAMHVELEFLLDGQRYRVLRKRNRGRNSQGDLQFQVRQENGEWRALTGQGVRGTQERINTVMRMDYETFINSAFLLQGRADEFARKTAGDRKRILGEILSLGVYDQLSDAARVRRAEAVQRVTALDAQIGQAEREFTRLPAYRAEAERLDAEHTRADLAAQKARGDLGEVQLEKARLDLRRRERDDLDRRVRSAEGRLKLDRDQAIRLHARVQASETLVARAAEIRTRAREYFAAVRERDELHTRFVELQGLQAQRGRVEQEIGQARYRLETELALARNRVRELHAKLEQQTTLHAELEDLERQEAALNRAQEELAGLQARLPDVAVVRAQARTEQERCREALEVADQRFQMLKEARAVCPLCEDVLSEEKRKDLGRKLRAEKEELKAVQGRAIQAEADAGREETDLRKRIRQLDHNLKAGQHMRARLAQVRQMQLQLEEAARQLPGEREVAERLAERLEAGDYLPEKRRELAELDARIQALNYRQSHFDALQRRVQELRDAEREQDRLEEMEKNLEPLRAEAAAQEASIRAQENEIAEDRAALAEANRDLARADEVDLRVRKLQAELAAAEAARNQVGQQLGAAQEAVQRCEALGTDLTRLRTERAAAAKDQALYEELVKAFGRNGIQALIIENALPEIEAEANTLLSRMSEGQLAVRLKTQRELKSGAHAETLEIEISDNIGPRRYELYSGGEAFRVNFAIRIALSKLLARRAGARLETLVIDEGFGSQDQEGRVRLVEAIQAVQDEFARILVITHIDELKDAFPTRIEVTKSLSGSQVAVY